MFCKFNRARTRARTRARIDYPRERVQHFDQEKDVAKDYLSQNKAGYRFWYEEVRYGGSNRGIKLKYQRYGKNIYQIEYRLFYKDQDGQWTDPHKHNPYRLNNNDYVKKFYESVANTLWTFADSDPTYRQDLRNAPNVQFELDKENFKVERVR